jgi:outer membrane protein insertion porin family
VDAVVNVTEKTSAGFSGGGGISAKGLQEGGLSALIANADYFRRNLFGRCQTLTARVEVSPNNLSSKPEIDVKIQHSDPWIGDAGRTSRRIFLDSDSSALDAIYAKADSRDGDAGDDADGGVADITDTNLGGEGEGTPFKGVFVKRVTSGVEYRRPLAACWTGSVSATYQRASTHDDLKQPILHDAYGAPLTFSGLPHDTTCNILMRFVYEGRGKDEAQLVVSAEQAVPVRPEMLAFNRVLVRAQRDFRVGGARLTVAAKGGNVIGDLPPYEAFSIGGASSVRGYPEGGVGTGRKFIVGSAEVAVPLAPDSINGCVFFDIGSDLKSGVSVLGDPGGTRGKPGQGYGYGAGVVALTPIGPVRLEYAFSDKGVGRMHCGLSRSF